MNKNNYLLPKLRFKEFTNNYIKIMLKDISTLKKIGNLSKKDVEENGKYNCILYGEIFTRYDSVLNKRHTLSKTNKKSTLISNSNCIVFPSSSTTLNDFFPCLSIKHEDIMLGQDINCFYVDMNYDSNYISYFFSKRKNKINIFKLTEGITINHLYGNDLKKVSLVISNDLLEQQKISKFLSLIDKQIELWERKLEFYLLFYNNLLQIVFNYSKLNQSNIKLKKFLILKKERVKNRDIEVATISNKLGLVSQKNYFKKELASSNISNYLVLKPNWFGFNPARINVGSIAMNNKKNDFCLSPMYSVFECLEHTRLIFHYFKSNIFLNLVKQRTSGTVRNSLSWEMLISIPFIEDESNFKLYEKRLDKTLLMIENVKTKLKLLKLKKTYFLNNLFV